MKRAYLWLVVAIVAAALLGIAVARHSGYVLIAYDSFRYESSLWATLGLLVAVVLLVLMVRLVLRLVFTSSGVVNPWSRRNHSRRTRLAVEQGQLDLAEGRWASAQRHLHRAAEAERQPLLYYLGAARAANELGRTEDSDNLLERALERQPLSCKIALQPEVRHHGGDEGVASQLAALLHRKGKDGHDLVTIDNRTGGINCKATVGIAIVCNAQVSAMLEHCSLKCA